MAQRSLGSAPGGRAGSWPLARACHTRSGTHTGPQILGDSIPPNSGDLPRLQITEPSQVPHQTEPGPHQEGPRSTGTPTPLPLRPGWGRKMALAGCSWLLLSGERERRPPRPQPPDGLREGRGPRPGRGQVGARGPAGWVGRASLAPPGGTGVGLAGDGRLDGFAGGPPRFLRSGHRLRQRSH